MSPRKPSPSKQRSRRLRKKLHVGEFREDGFNVRFRFRPALTQDDHADVLPRLVAQVIEPRSLRYGGGQNGFVTKVGRGSPSEEDRRAVTAWLESCAQVQHVDVGPNEDAWYGPDQD
jgi:uncharacterized protein